jgi:hypothetical protein
LQVRQLTINLKVVIDPGLISFPLGIEILDTSGDLRGLPAPKI